MREILAGLAEMLTGGKVFANLFHNNLRFIIMLFGLGILFTTNFFWVQDRAKKRQTLRNEIIYLKSEATTLEMELVRLSSRSEIKNEIEKRNLNLIENKVPPIVLKMETEK
ncbi:hypothetical protein AGMMS4956_13590 [Bacteroidia bacterium]|nr:hypothetical protein AGMMS4956_13590 [Bacteroidia bacterium]